MGRGGVPLSALCALLHWQLGLSVRLQSSKNPERGGRGSLSLLATASQRGRFGVARDSSVPDSKSANSNCSLLPEICEAPFNCHMKREEKRVYASADGHADYSNWCGGIHMYPAVHCQRGRLRKYARSLHYIQKAWSLAVENLDAHYCFALGHCDDEEITENTTLSQMEAICDKRFGHSAWTQMQKWEPVPADYENSTYGPYLNAQAERNFAMIACAMGNFHCDNVYCKQEYCLSPEFRARWGDHRPKEMIAKYHNKYPRHFRAG